VHDQQVLPSRSSKVTVVTDPASPPVRLTVTVFMGEPSPSILASIELVLALQFLDHLVQRPEARGPELVIFLDLRGFSSSRHEPSLQVRTRPTGRKMQGRRRTVVAHVYTHVPAAAGGPFVELV
jgi:hypothetical protein